MTHNFNNYPTTNSETKKVAVFNDISGFGKCSLTAAIAVLSVMGIQPCPIPTAVLTNQTEFNHYYCADMTEHIGHYADIWKKNNEDFDGIYSGYVDNQEQIDIISDFITKFKKSYTKILVDPVMGDNGSTYPSYTAKACEKMRKLAKKADLITPNLTELCILSDINYNDLKAKETDSNYFEVIAKTAHNLIAHQNQSIVVTGILKDSYIYNAVFSKTENIFIKSEKYGNSFSGTGDLFASVLCGYLINNMDIVSGVDKASKFIETAIKDTIKSPFDRNHGINFEKYLYTLATGGNN
ncbi:MAG: pyridoxamine kinase [Ruminococcus sp.]|nr:pyridoxamine kinase [Ruminococcus sp.]